MLKRRQILCIEAESIDSPTYALPSITELLGLSHDSPSARDLSRLQSLAAQRDAEDKKGKAGKAKLQYLILALEKFPDLCQEWKKQASAVVEGMEMYAMTAMKEQKLKLAGRVIGTVDRALENGLKVAHRKKHQMRMLHIHAYLALYSNKLTLAIQYVEQSKLLEGKKAHVLLKCTSRLLEAYIYALQLDHKIAMKLLRESLTLQTRHRVPEQISSTEELNWFFRLLVVTLYNLAAESVNLHLRADAIQYAEKARQIVNENKEIAVFLCNKVARLHAAVLPTETTYESVTVPTEVSEESKLPFLPGGKVEDRPGKIVEVTQESSPTPDDSLQKLPRVSPLSRAGGKTPFQTSSKRYRSVPPSQRRKFGF